MAIDPAMRQYHFTVSFSFSSLSLFLPFSPVPFQTIFTAPSELRKVLFSAPSILWFFCLYEIISGTVERICAKFTRKTCLVPRSDEYEGQGQRSRLSGTKTAFFGSFGGLHAVYVW